MLSSVIAAVRCALEPSPHTLERSGVNGAIGSEKPVGGTINDVIGGLDQFGPEPMA